VRDKRVAKTSLSLEVSKCCPSSTSPAWSAWVLVRLPLWARATGPSCPWSKVKGWALLRREEPVVE
jgi:hypothetical protein